MTSDEREMMRRLTVALDGCLPMLEVEAAKEKRREAGKTMRQTTMQMRHQHIRKLVDDAVSMLEGAA